MNRTNLLLLHGALGASSQLYPLIPHLKDRHENHTLDFEGHGSSPLKDRPFRAMHFAENVMDYMDIKGINAVDIFGHSMGGQVGVCMARFFPDRVKRVFTLGTKFIWTPEIAEKENAFLDPKKMREDVPQFVKELQEKHVASGWETVLEKVREMMVNLGQKNPLEDNDIRQITKRVRIGVGDRDKMVGIEESVGVYRLLQEGELQILPGTPHPIERVSLAKLTHAMIDFFD